MTIRRPLVAAVLAGVVVPVMAARPAVAGDEKKLDVKKRKLAVFVEGTGCGFEIEPKPLALRLDKREALGLRIKNDCGFEQKALLCVYGEDGRRASPFEACTSAPPGLGLGAAIGLAAGGGKADVDCAATQPGRYGVVVIVGRQVPAGCPAAPPKERLGPAGDTVRNHHLEVEIVP